MLSTWHALNPRQAERVGARMDRLASQLLEVSPPPAMEAVHQRLGTTPAGSAGSPPSSIRWAPQTAKAEWPRRPSAACRRVSTTPYGAKRSAGFRGGRWRLRRTARSDAERRGVALPEVLPCDAHGPDGTALAGCAKLYLPVGEAPPSERPFAFVLQLAREMDSTLAFVAFGHRDPRAACAASTSARIVSCMPFPERDRS